MNRISGYVALIFVILSLVGSAYVLAGNYYINKPKSVGFESDVIFLKISVPENSDSINNVKIKNLLRTNQQFSANISGIENIVSLVNDNFSLFPGEEKKIQLNFKSKDVKPGVYAGELIVSSKKEMKEIPIIFEVESSNVVFDSNVDIYPQGKDLIVGQEVNSRITVYDLQSAGRSSVNVNYIVKDFNSHTLFSESETMTVDGKLEYSKSFPLSDELKPGAYVLITTVQHMNSVGVSSVYFRVFGQNYEFYSFSGGIGMIVAFIVFFASLIILLIYIFYGIYRMFSEAPKTSESTYTQENI